LMSSSVSSRKSTTSERLLRAAHIKSVWCFCNKSNRRIPSQLGATAEKCCNNYRTSLHIMFQVSRRCTGC
jgi:hypothetical protein